MATFYHVRWDLDRPHGWRLPSPLEEHRLLETTHRAILEALRMMAGEPRRSG